MLDLAAIFTADPINIFYATGARNMSIYSMMGAVRFMLVVADGPVIVWEFAGSEHLLSGLDTIDDVRTAPGVTALSGPGYLDSIGPLAAEIADACDATPSSLTRVGVERVDHPVTDALRAAGITLASATDGFVAARRIKLPGEIELMDEAMERVRGAVAALRTQVVPGRSEIEVWAELHRHLIAHGGEYISTRLVQAGQRTFPYFHEAGTNVLQDGDLLCVDTDAIGYGGYAVDFSRTYLCGSSPATSAQRTLHSLALEQLRHNVALLGPGVSFEDLARKAWDVPARYAPYGYYCVAHGLGLSGEYPYVPIHDTDQPYPLDGQFEPGMVICVESYIGDADEGQGVKLEDQLLLTDTGVRRMSTSPFDSALT